MRWVAIVMLVAAGCTTTNDYAVIASQQQMWGPYTCFRQCQTVRTSNTNTYLSCLRTCPEVYVNDDQDCEAAQFDRTAYQCMTEHNKSFTAWPVIIIIVVVVLLGALAGAGSSTKN